jgi:hypothetical protein
MRLLHLLDFVLIEFLPHGASTMARKMRMKTKSGKRVARRAWSREQVKELKDHSRAKTPVSKIAKMMKRTAGALRQKALTLGLPLGHRR